MQHAIPDFAGGLGIPEQFPVFGIDHPLVDQEVHIECTPPVGSADEHDRHRRDLASLDQRQHFEKFVERTVTAGKHHQGAGALQKVVAGRLPLDVFSFEAGDGLSGSRVEAGKNLGSRLYLGYVGRAGANPALLQNRNAVHLEYQFTSRWSLDAEYGDVGTGTADLFWTKRY